jgi:hypothetical protein
MNEEKLAILRLMDIFNRDVPAFAFQCAGWHAEHYWDNDKDYFLDLTEELINNDFLEPSSNDPKLFWVAEKGHNVLDEYHPKFHKRSGGLTTPDESKIEGLEQVFQGKPGEMREVEIDITAYSMGQHYWVKLEEADNPFYDPEEHKAIKIWNHEAIKGRHGFDLEKQCDEAQEAEDWAKKRYEEEFDDRTHIYHPERTTVEYIEKAR